MVQEKQKEVKGEVGAPQNQEANADAHGKVARQK
jgi:hypothetical protein